MAGMDVVNVNYRGLAGAKLTTPRMYCCAAVNDVIEPLLSIYERFGKNSNQKCYVIGFSMGASMVANALGTIDREHGGPLYDGACIIQCPLKIWICYKSLSSACFGLYDRNLGMKYSGLMLDHEYALKDEVKKVCNVDLREQLKSWGFRGTTFKKVDTVFTSKLFGFKNGGERAT